MGGFLSASAKPILQLLSGRVHYVFPVISWIFTNFASQPMIMKICKEFRVEWESVVFFGMNEKKWERGEERKRRGLKSGGCVVLCCVVLCCVVLCCVVLCCVVLCCVVLCCVVLCCVVLCCVVLWWCVL